jgi:hypothetical protein
MKNLIFTLVGALFLFVSCQSDDLQMDEALKSDKATKVTKDMTIRSYEGFIEIEGPVFTQTGGGIATHIGTYTFVNTATFPDFPGTFSGVMTAANGDEIYYNSPVIVCDGDPNVSFCPEAPATFTYTIDGGTGRFDGATGTITINGPFVPAGPFTATGYAEITY